jgi:hypothetical protein
MVLKEEISLFTHTLAKITPTCLMLMVQGNFLAISLKHWGIAFTVSIITGLILVVLSLIKRFEDIKSNNYSMAGLVAFVTALVDFNVHHSHFGGVTTEALVTGISAGLLWLALSFTPLGKKND